MARRIELARPGGGATIVVITERTDGDFHIDSDPGTLRERRAELHDHPWAVVRQVHGNRVVEAGDAGPQVEADAIVTDTHRQPIAVQGADCAPVALVTAGGPIGVAHVGWRGLLAGVLENTADRLRSRGDDITHAIVGPVIGPECYPFGEAELGPLEARFGPSVRGRTSTGEVSLDLRAGITCALVEAAVRSVRFEGDCTACSGRWFSHRVGAERRRHTLVAWIER